MTIRSKFIFSGRKSQLGDNIYSAGLMRPEALFTKKSITIKMRISRIYIDSILNELHRISDGVTLNYINNVLRLGIKDRATLFNGNGEEAIYELLEISHKYANLKKLMT